MEHRFLDYSFPFQVLDNDPLQQLGSNSGVPDAVGVYDNDRPPFANPEAGGFSTFYPRWAIEETFPVEEGGEKSVQLPALPLRRTECAGADDDVPGVRLHSGEIGCHW